MTYIKNILKRQKPELFLMGIVVALGLTATS